MNPDAVSVETWGKILSGLMAGATCGKDDRQRVLDQAPANQEARRRERRSGISLVCVSGDEVGRCASIRILDRTEKKATIAWHDSTSCHYEDQRWTRSIAARVGVCAMSGEMILRGADIFRPSRANPVPANAGAMILTSALPTLDQAGDDEINDDNDGPLRRY
jgi:hypothetical protein